MACVPMKPRSAYWVATRSQPESVWSRLLLLENLRAELAEPPFDLGAALLDLSLDREALGHLILLGDLEADDELLAVRLAVERVTGRIGPTVLQRQQHRRHLLTHIAGLATMNQSRNPTHTRVPFARGLQCLQGRKSQKCMRSHSDTVAMNFTHSSRL